MKGQTYFIFALIFALIVAVFAVINVGNVEVNYLFGSGQAPLILVILFSVLLGGLITALVGARRFYQLKREIKQLKNEKMNENSSSTTTSNSEDMRPADDSSDIGEETNSNS
ncbi:LapA family protein [Halobacillus campisalis]|uniref:Lipopolysaccharide assembly LapA domain-containing protein n=1 Tax=Halobacillus campisalis TaxID=435909 RepID=A0ABW2K4A7_9BACI|nr:lipopolysaccharide assembly protein LapA domain-containing protein [Halobacillus campisalis]